MQGDTPQGGSLLVCRNVYLVSGRRTACAISPSAPNTVVQAIDSVVFPLTILCVCVPACGRECACACAWRWWDALCNVSDDGGRLRDAPMGIGRWGQEWEESLCQWEHGVWRMIWLVRSVLLECWSVRLKV